MPVKQKSIHLLIRIAGGRQQQEETKVSLGREFQSSCVSCSGQAYTPLKGIGPVSENRSTQSKALKVGCNSQVGRQSFRDAGPKPYKALKVNKVPILCPETDWKAEYMCQDWSDMVVSTPELSPGFMQLLWDQPEM